MPRSESSPWGRQAMEDTPKEPRSGRVEGGSRSFGCAASQTQVMAELNE